jgi:hypothetical protein
MIAMATSSRLDAMNLSRATFSDRLLWLYAANHFSDFIALATPGITFGNPFPSSLSFV